LLERFDLLERRDHLPTSFSKGMKQKIMIIINMLIDCELYIVDEPFVGLDPLATKEFLDLIEERRAQGAGVLLSTHVLDTAEKICNSFLMVHNGKLVAKGSLNDIRTSCDLPKGTLFDCFYSILKRNGGAR
jgi:ABC-2 type transport system ATP-binding protein